MSCLLSYYSAQALTTFDDNMAPKLSKVFLPQHAHPCTVQKLLEYELMIYKKFMRYKCRRQDWLNESFLYSRAPIETHGGSSRARRWKMCTVKRATGIQAHDWGHPWQLWAKQYMPIMTVMNVLFWLILLDLQSWWLEYRLEYFELFTYVFWDPFLELWNHASRNNDGKNDFCRY